MLCAWHSANVTYSWYMHGMYSLIYACAVCYGLLPSATFMAATRPHLCRHATNVTADSSPGNVRPAGKSTFSSSVSMCN